MQAGSENDHPGGKTISPAAKMIIQAEKRFRRQRK
jgi:hypothetical protein